MSGPLKRWRLSDWREQEEAKNSDFSLIGLAGADKQEWKSDMSRKRSECASELPLLLERSMLFRPQVSVIVE
jgi:hypothetical protein